MPAENSAQKQRKRGRPFVRGRSGNPRGRPAGVRNRASILLEAISEGDLEDIVAKVVEKAKAGDLVAAKLIFDRVAPAPKSRAVAIGLPAIGQWDGIDAVLCAYRTIVEDVTGGHISPQEGLELVALIEAHRATVKELRPEAMYSEPTPEERAEQKRRNEAYAKVYKRFQAAVAK